MAGQTKQHRGHVQRQSSVIRHSVRLLKQHIPELWLLLGTKFTLLPTHSQSHIEINSSAFSDLYICVDGWGFINVFCLLEDRWRRPMITIWDTNVLLCRFRKEAVLVGFYFQTFRLSFSVLYETCKWPFMTCKCLTLIECAEWVLGDEVWLHCCLLL